ncbi:hypothetical protein, partial [Enterobacter asburiae]|uniref:hypothetical protein n=1 Tax=Enterobacter asburiae TaxID=61645 RepID=UPI003BEEEA4C
HGDVLMWLMKTLLTSGCTNQRGAGHYNHEPEKKQEPDKTSRPVAFPPLPKESKVPAKSKGFTLTKLRFGLGKRKDE